MGYDKRPLHAASAIHKCVSEPMLKITDAPSAFAEKVEVGPIVGPKQPLPKSVFAPPLAGPMPPFDDPCYGRQTVKRFTDQEIERGMLRNMPRFFDNLPTLRTEAKDFEPIDHSSSFDLIKARSIRKENERRQIA